MGKKETQAMRSFVQGVLEQSPRVKIQSTLDDKIFLTDLQTGNPVEVYLHGGPTKQSDFHIEQRSAYDGSRGVIHVFFKDGEHYFLKLADRESLRADKSLKVYTVSQIKQMVSLRTIEKLALRLTDTLTYYRPEEENRAQAIEVFQMLPVTLDYSHLQGTNEFARGQRISVDYKLPDLLKSIFDGTTLQIGYHGNKLLPKFV
ncbi:hypothetical protein C4573_02280 [Candidatus Woesearchaeota archaeon]|nr:MAG: hypothetical protein C4573_02280 [Candidatus Woesearchaeota archaeon]